MHTTKLRIDGDGAELEAIGDPQEILNVLYLPLLEYKDSQGTEIDKFIRELDTYFSEVQVKVLCGPSTNWKLVYEINPLPNPYSDPYYEVQWNPDIEAFSFRETPQADYIAKPMQIVLWTRYQHTFKRWIIHQSDKSDLLKLRNMWEELSNDLTLLEGNSDTDNIDLVLVRNDWHEEEWINEPRPDSKDNYSGLVAWYGKDKWRFNYIHWAETYHPDHYFKEAIKEKLPLVVQPEDLLKFWKEYQKSLSKEYRVFFQKNGKEYSTIIKSEEPLRIEEYGNS